jgi:hydrogenase maturation protein HypF
MVPASDTVPARLRLEIRGAVQGVGFRPFVFRLAEQMGLSGWVLNDTRGVFLEAEGPRAALERLRARVRDAPPPRAVVQSVEEAWLEPVGYDGFEIRASDGAGERTALVLPDIATCGDCLAEATDPSDRRYGYPFTNCTNCGPRFTILESLPYDRPGTTMRGFTLCDACRAEYESPRDRRFHAQPNACPACGPRLELWSPVGETLERGAAALRSAAAALAGGRIVAVKGLGGFHLMCDARDPAAVRRLRERKPRREKPFALMARDLAMARALCELSPIAERHLLSPEAPILLLPRRADAQVADEVAPGNPWLGVMLPATPLHHLLLGACGFPVVATSGNLSDEPICTDEREALGRLGGVAELFLVHDRPIARHVDDSVAWVFGGGVRLLRRARGFAPLPVTLARGMPPILAVGAHLKNTVALAVGRQAFVSQHIGDLETREAMDAFERVIADFRRLYGVQPEAIAHDLHPDYLSTRWAHETAEREGVRLLAVQHHHAHLAACLAENGVEAPALGIVWDGTGYGTDATVWGGEFLLGDARGCERVAHLRPFRLPGGEAAIREPRRVALALLWETLGPEALEDESLPVVSSFSRSERAVLARMLERGIQAPLTTSVGRLFDGVAALLGLSERVTFEGQAAMALEFAADPREPGAYAMEVAKASEIEPAEGVVLPGAGSGVLIVNWRPMIGEVLSDLARGVPAGIIAARFHNALALGALTVAQMVREPRVALSGGCFQNRRLTEKITEGLEHLGRVVLLHAQVPPNDGGISLGQIAVAAAQLRSEAEGGD